MRFNMASHSWAESSVVGERMRFSTSTSDLYNLENFLRVRHVMRVGMNLSSGKIMMNKGTNDLMHRSTMLANSNERYWDKKGIPFL